MKRQGILISIVLAIVFAMAVLKLSNLLSFFDLYLLLKVTFFFLLSVFLIYLIQKKHSFYLPSFYLFIFFSIVPILGTMSHHIYIKLYRDVAGAHLNMKYALDLWLQGTFFLILGIFLTHMVMKVFSKYGKHSLEAVTYTSWNWEYFHYILFLLAGISLVLTIAAVWKIGYIPIFKGDIATERFQYASRVGEWTYKLAKLWLLVYLFSFIKLLKNIRLDRGFYIRKNLALIFILISSMFFAGIYGARYHQFIMIVFSIIMVNKVIKRIRISYIALLFIGCAILSVFVVIARSRFIREQDLPIHEKLIHNTFGEFRTFAYSVQEYPERDFLHGKGFLSTLAPMFPKQVWQAFNINKEKLSNFGSAAIMRDIFGAIAGIRIGIIGEGFINFGYLGIILVPLLSGILFGVLENIFLSLRCFDVKEIIVAFAISIMMYLPLAQSNALTSAFVFHLYIIIGCIILFYKRQIIRN
jgi:hypothetical protein